MSISSCDELALEYVAVSLTLARDRERPAGGLRIRIHRDHPDQSEVPPQSVRAESTQRLTRKRYSFSQLTVREYPDPEMLPENCELPSPVAPIRRRSMSITS